MQPSDAVCTLCAYCSEKRVGLQHRIMRIVSFGVVVEAIVCDSIVATIRAKPKLHGKTTINSVSYTLSENKF